MQNSQDCREITIRGDWSSAPQTLFPDFHLFCFLIKTYSWEITHMKQKFRLWSWRESNFSWNICLMKALGNFSKSFKFEMSHLQEQGFDEECEDWWNFVSEAGRSFIRSFAINFFPVYKIMLTKKSIKYLINFSIFLEFRFIVSDECCRRIKRKKLF